MKKLSIIIPCYNEKNHIPLILSHFAAVIETRPIEVILVNNGSTDGSEKIFNEKLSICTGAPVILEATTVTADLIIWFLIIAIHTKEKTTIPSHIRNFFIE